MASLSLISCSTSPPPYLLSPLPSIPPSLTAQHNTASLLLLQHRSRPVPCLPPPSVQKDARHHASRRHRHTPGPPKNAKLGTAPKPSCKDKPGTLLVKVAYTALNRADTLQRQGLDPPPPGASEILGLELSGIIVEIGPDVDVTAFQMGDRVMSLVSGGAYAEYCLVDAATTMRLPPSLPLRLAAAIPEAWLMAYQLLHFVGHFEKKKKQGKEFSFTQVRPVWAWPRFSSCLNNGASRSRPPLPANFPLFTRWVSYPPMP